MKYYIVERQGELILFKVANDLVETFEKESMGKIIAEGNSILEALLNLNKGMKIRVNWI